MEFSADQVNSMSPLLQQTFRIDTAADPSGEWVCNKPQGMAENDKLKSSSASINSLDASFATEPQITSLDCRTSSANFNNGRDQSVVSVGLGETNTGNQEETTESETPGEMLDPEEIQAPIVGFETMEERSRFTVFKIQVQKSEDHSWLVFRRFSEFVKLNQKLSKLFPGFRLALPPKRWFRNNFSQEFLEDRTHGLEAFLRNITGHKDICNSKPVKEFLHFSHSQGLNDNNEDREAVCEVLEERVHELSMELEERDEKIKLLQDELEVYRQQVFILTTRLREMSFVVSKDLLSPVSNCASLAECDRPSPLVSPIQEPRESFFERKPDGGAVSHQVFTSSPLLPKDK